MPRFSTTMIIRHVCALILLLLLLLCSLAPESADGRQTAQHKVPKTPQYQREIEVENIPGPKLVRAD